MLNQSKSEIYFYISVKQLNQMLELLNLNLDLNSFSSPEIERQGGHVQDFLAS